MDVFRVWNWERSFPVFTSVMTIVTAIRGSAIIELFNKELGSLLRSGFYSFVCFLLANLIRSVDYACCCSFSKRNVAVGVCGLW